MFNRSEILRKAWTSYRRDEFMGVCGPRRGEGFNRKRFAYNLRMAWAAAKEEAAKAVKAAALVPAPAKVLPPAAAARVEAIRSELFDLQMGDFVPWARHSALSAELAALAR
jgi:hypothetical protein